MGAHQGIKFTHVLPYAFLKVQHLLDKALVSASEKFGDRPLVQASELSALGTRHTHVVQQAEKMLCIAREVISSVGCNAVARSQLLGLMDVRVAHHVLQKQCPAKGSFLSLSHIGWQTAHDF